MVPHSATAGVGHIPGRREAVDGGDPGVQQRAWPVAAPSLDRCNRVAGTSEPTTDLHGFAVEAMIRDHPEICALVLNSWQRLSPLFPRKRPSMTSDRPEHLHRLVSTSDAVESLTSFFSSEEPLDDVLSRVARTALGAIPDADAVTITVLADPKPRTAAYTETRVLRVDLAQYSSGRGPCLEAAERRTPVRVVADIDQQRWPEFVEVARDEGVRASLSVPLIVDAADPRQEGELVGSLNIYSRSASAFDPFDEELMRLYTVAASQAITLARRWQYSRETVAQLEKALISRTEIDQAKGALRAIHGYGANEAFARLAEESQRRNVKLHTVAREFLDSLAQQSD
jgi:putative methionine-R-sulfoxide reductase with GAF domain